MHRFEDLTLSPSDQEALERAVAGLGGEDPLPAVRVICERLYEPLRDVVARRLESDPIRDVDADEIVQETAIHLTDAAMRRELAGVDTPEALWRLLVLWANREIRDRARAAQSRRRGQVEEAREFDEFYLPDLPDEPRPPAKFTIRRITPEPPGPMPEAGPAPLEAEEAARILRESGHQAAARAGPAPLPGGDPVDCTAFAPPEARPGDMLLVQVLAHLPGQAGQARALAEEVDAEARQRGSTSLALDVPLGARLDVHLRMPGLVVDDEVAVLIWRGRPASAQFGVAVPAGHPPQTVIATVTISQDRVPVGQIKFPLRVTAAAEARTAAPAGQAQAFESFFASYASQDRPEVLKRVQMALRLGKRVFQDVLDLDPGDRWERKLYHHIDESDAVLLFWSSHAKGSEWVMRECRYAIEKKGIERLIPVILEGPPPVEPPPELAALHFNDRLLYFMR